jgi:ABC-2 type transport system ATP-binding protein
MNILEIKNLTKKFGNFSAVDNISFSLHEGEILGFLGPNGAGKTTTIQMLLGTLTPTTGEIVYFGKNFSSAREEIMERVNFSSTYSNLPGDLTVKEVLTYTSYFYNITDRKKRVVEIRDLFRLDDLFSQQIHELSAGELTRVNLAKAFINFPKILLLDEPTASLDPEIAKYVREFLLDERKKFNVSILLTSHNMAEVQEVCDRVIFINEGKLVADDTPENLAKSMKISHIELLVKDGLKRIEAICEKKNLNCRVKGRHINVDLDESKIPSFLDKLASDNIRYDEISIQKPTLEDYFIEKVTKK